MRFQVVIFLSLAFAALTESLVLTDPKTGLRSKYLGCFLDKDKDRTMGSKPYYHARKLIDWSRYKNMSYIVNICAEEARHQVISIFAVQDWGDCMADSSTPPQYNKHGKSKNCHSHVGGSWANAVYELINTCSANGKEHSDASKFYIPQNPINYQNMGCEECKCNRGVATCKHLSCDHFSACEKYVPPAPGTCCPICECYHQGKKYKNGESWPNRKSGSCFQCQCINGTASCEKPLCPNCPNPQYVPWKCCPQCIPGAPTTYPWETLPTTRSAPTLPHSLSPQVPREPSKRGKQPRTRHRKRYQR